MVQTAANLVLEPIFVVAKHASGMKPISIPRPQPAPAKSARRREAYGYRPQRSGLDAVRRVHGLLKTGYTDVVPRTPPA